MLSKYHKKTFVISYTLIMIITFSGCTPAIIQERATASNKTPTQIPTKVLTTPTLTSTTAVQLIYSILEDNSGCRLPCIWGITPGKTTLDDLKLFINSFGENDLPGIYYSDPSIYENLGGLGVGVWENGIKTSYRFDYRGTEKIEYLLLSAEAYQVNGQGMDQSAVIAPIQLNKALLYYTPQRVLSNYGEPDQIILAPFPDTPERPALWVPFSLVLFYKEEGILIEYVAPKTITEESFDFCPSQLASISIFTWQPQNELKLDNVVNFYSGYKLSSTTISYYKNLEDSTSLTIREFTEIFKNTDVSYCIQSPSIYWTSQ